MIRGLYWILRVFLGGVTLGSGVGKALDIAGFVGVLQTYELRLPGNVLFDIAVTVTVVELCLGLWLLWGRAPIAAATIGMFLYASYFTIMSQALARGLAIPNCGCYGVFLAEPLKWYSPLEDILQIALLAVYSLVGGVARRVTL